MFIYFLKGPLNNLIILAFNNKDFTISFLLNYYTLLTQPTLTIQNRRGMFACIIKENGCFWHINIYKGHVVSNSIILMLDPEYF